MVTTLVKKKVAVKPPLKAGPQTAADRKLIGEMYADMLGKLQAKIGPLRMLDADYKGILKEMTKGKSTAFNGKLYRATVSWSTPMILNKEKAKKYMTVRQFNSCLEAGETKGTVKVVSLNNASKKI